METEFFDSNETRALASAPGASVSRKSWEFDALSGWFQAHQWIKSDSHYTTLSFGSVGAGRPKIYLTGALCFDDLSEADLVEFFLDKLAKHGGPAALRVFCEDVAALCLQRGADRALRSARNALGIDSGGALGGGNR